MNDKKKIIMLSTGCVLILAMIILAILVPSAEKPKSENTVQSEDEDLQVQNEGVPVTYEMLVDMPSGYVFADDPIVRTATSHYVDVLNALYKGKGSKENAECMTLKEAFDYAGLSEKVYLEVMKYHGKEYRNNPDILHVRENGVAYDKDRTYFLITSKTDTNLYYIGEVKNKRPQGNGAIFEEVDGNLTLKFAGTFEDGSKKGKGISFASYGPLLFIEQIAKYEEGHEKGKVHRFHVVEKDNIQNSYQALERVIDSYDDANTLFVYIYNNFKTSDMEAVILKWLVRNPYTIYLDQPVVKCSVGFVGKMKNGEQYKGRLYDLFGCLVYKGNVKKAGITLNEGVYPLYSQAAYYERYTQNAAIMQGAAEYASDISDVYDEDDAEEQEAGASPLETVSGNDLEYQHLPQQWRGEEEDSTIYDPNPYFDINSIPFRPYISPATTYQTPSQTPSQSYEPPEPEADDTGTTVIDIGLE